MVYLYLTLSLTVKEITLMWNWTGRSEIMYFGISSSKKEQHHLIYSFLSTCSLLFSYLQWLCHPHQLVMSPLPLHITPTPHFLLLHSLNFLPLPFILIPLPSCCIYLSLLVLYLREDEMTADHQPLQWRQFTRLGPSCWLATTAYKHHVDS